MTAVYIYTYVYVNIYKYYMHIYIYVYSRVILVLVGTWEGQGDPLIKGVKDHSVTGLQSKPWAFSMGPSSGTHI